ncbi:MAG: AMP-binding protein [Synergistaceae bacterium]|nr:AMP-binding protein [Synergistaceae bacterium]
MWNFDAFGNNVAIIDDSGTRLTYSQLKHETEAIAEAAGKRCLVFVLCSDTIGSVMGYAAFMNAGIVPLMLSRHIEPGLLSPLMDAYRPKYMWLPSDMARGDEVFSARGYSLVRTSFTEECPLHPDLALLLTTSGSTGSPKFVRQSYTNILDNAKSIAEYLRLDETERPISTLPMNYTYGLSIINSHFLVGATLLLTEKAMTQKEFWQFFREAGATSFGGVPYTYEMLDRMRFQRMSLPSLRTMTQAGGKITPELHRKFAEYARDSGKNFIVMYGQCEASPRMGYLPADKAIEKAGSMGIAIPGGKFRLIGEDGREIQAPHVTGELEYTGKNVAMGYAECGDDLSKGDEWGGVLRTGDMAQFDEDGYFYVVGRKKRFLKVYGNRVNLDELDRLIKGKFPVECASAGEDDRVHIFITAGANPDDVRNFAATTTKLNPKAFTVITLDEIPKSESGKTLFTELAKYWRKTE